MILPLALAGVTASASTNQETTAEGDDMAEDRILDIEGAKEEIPEAPLDTPVPTTDLTRALGARPEQYIDPAIGTVAGQLDTLLAKGSPLMTRAGQLADTRSQALGGSMAGSAAQYASTAAMIDRMTPIAQQDAATYANLGTMSKSFDQSLGAMDKQQQQTFQSMDKEFGMTQTVNAQMNYWTQQMQQGDYDQATKATLMAGYQSLSEQYIASLAAAGASAEFSQDEADALTKFYNDNMTNFFNVANYGNLKFT